ncbi:MAG: xanthine dehydrogenase family protein molybdopterin-binding subunit [Chloroflexota bacterium]|nr:xanthine dehydrogenase family protein molybdopterin-binding subunit [Chloroflexota bacterium]
MATVMKTTRDVKGIGVAIPRHDAPEKVTGRTEYVDDVRLRGMLHTRVLRSPHAHARIVRTDTSRAKALPGVRAVLTAADIPELHAGAKTRGHAIMAIDRVIFAGQPVAAVAADELAIADEALDLIDVEYEVLPVAVDPIESMRPDAPRVADEGTEADTSEALAHSGIAPTENEAVQGGPNVAQQSHLHRGDIEAGFAEADLVIENTYHVPMVHQGYIEPHACIASVDQTGGVTIWTSTQGSFNTRSEVADILHIPEARIKVIPMECGGGFGAKIRALCEPIAVLLSRATGRPVKFIMTRREELQAGMPAPSVTIKLKTGVKADGTPLALQGETVIEAGAYSGAVLTMSGVFLASVYQWPNFDVRGYEVLTHKPSIAAYRAPMAPQTAFAIDSQMDQIARKLGLDPAEYKLRHLQKGGDLMAHGQPWQVNGARECLEELMRHPLWTGRAEWRASGGKDGVGLRGTGLSVGGWVPGIQPTSASVKLNPDGSLTVLTGAVDIAGTNMGLALIAAEAYGVDVDRVKIVTGDTDTSPLTGISAGSKTTYTVGAAVIEAARDARNQTLEIAAGELEASPSDLEIVGDEVVVQGVPDKSITLAAIGKKGNTFQSKVPPVLGSSALGFSVQAPAFAAQLARIEVDPDTGQIILHDFVCVQDVGKAINPLGIEGQMQGGAVQSLGFALTEGLQFDSNGRVMNPSLLDYRKLTAADVPDIETRFVEVPAPAGPFGARGVGEPPIVPALAAVANAVQDATGVRLTTLPLTPERVALALADREDGA